MATRTGTQAPQYFLVELVRELAKPEVQKALLKLFRAASHHPAQYSIRRDPKDSLLVSFLEILGVGGLDLLYQHANVFPNEKWDKIVAHLVTIGTILWIFIPQDRSVGSNADFVAWERKVLEHLPQGEAEMVGHMLSELRNSDEYKLLQFLGRRPTREEVRRWLGNDAKRQKTFDMLGICDPLDFADRIRDFREAIGRDWSVAQPMLNEFGAWLGTNLRRAEAGLDHALTPVNEALTRVDNGKWACFRRRWITRTNY